MLRSKTCFKNICYLISGQTFLLHMVVGFIILLISKELFIFIHHICVKYPNGKCYWNYSICSLSPWDHNLTCIRKFHSLMNGNFPSEHVKEKNNMFKTNKNKTNNNKKKINKHKKSAPSKRTPQLTQQN